MAVFDDSLGHQFIHAWCAKFIMTKWSVTLRAHSEELLYPILGQWPQKLKLNGNLGYSFILKFRSDIKNLWIGIRHNVYLWECSRSCEPFSAKSLALRQKPSEVQFFISQPHNVQHTCMPCDLFGSLCRIRLAKWNLNLKTLNPRMHISNSMRCFEISHSHSQRSTMGHFSPASRASIVLSTRPVLLATLSEIVLVCFECLLNCRTSSAKYVESDLLNSTQKYAEFLW